VGSIVAAGDKGVTGITPELRTQFRDVKRASIAYGQADSKPGLGNLLDPRNLVGAFSGDLSDDAAIDAYLNMGTNLAKFREFTLSAEERAVLESMYGTGDLETALAALPSAYTDDYKNTVRWYDGAYNDADLRVDVRNNGIIESATGDGIRLIRRWVRDRNGAARVVIHEGGSITAHRYGIRMRGAGMDAAYALGDFQGPLRKHFVTVHGRVVSTGPEGAALAFLGGGEVTLGPTAHVRAASGTVIKIDDVDPGINLILVLEAADGEDAPALFRRLLPGRIDNGGNDANYVVFVRDPETKQVTRVPLTSLRSGGAEIGAYEVGMDRMVLTPPARATDALPIVLTDMMVDPGVHPAAATPIVSTRGHAGPGGTWIGVLAATANHQSSKTLNTNHGNSIWDSTRSGLILGHDIALGGGNTLGLALQRQQARTTVMDTDAARSSRITTQATGLALTHRWNLAPVTLGLHATATAFSSDITVAGQTVVTDLSGTGVAVGVDAAHRAALSGATLITEAGLTHAVVKTKDYTIPASGNDLAVTAVKSDATTLRLRTVYQRPVDAGQAFVGGSLELPVGGRSQARAGTTLLAAERRARAHLHGGVAFNRGPGGGNTVLSLGYAKQRSGGESLQTRLTHRF